MPEQAESAPRALRNGYAVIQSITLAVFVTLSFVARRFEAILDQLEMKPVPAPTELCLAVARLVRTPAGLAILAALGATLVVLAKRGTFDRALRKLIILNVLGTLGLVTFYVLSVFLPIQRVSVPLSNPEAFR
jgi:hypothetical protein